MISSERKESWLFTILVTVLLFLPLFEAPKNIVWFAFCIFSSWYLYEGRSHNLRTYDSAWLLWFFTSFATTIYASYVYQVPNDGWYDIARFISFGFFISLLEFDRRRIQIIVWIITVSVLLGIIEGYVGIYLDGGGSLELHSVGHVNHSSIYLVLALSVILSYIAILSSNRIERSVLFVVSLFIFSVIIDSESRAASGVSVIVVFVSLFFFLRRNISIMAGFSLMLLSIFLVSYLIINSSVYDKHRQWSERYSNELSARERINNLSKEVFLSYPLFGIGHGNYKDFAEKSYLKLAAKKDEKYISDNYLINPHAHNLYYTYLVSSGVIGFLGMLSFFLIGSYLLSVRLIRTWGNFDSVLSFSRLSFSFMLFINLSIGLVNTTLHHEHAMLSMLAAGLFFSHHRYVNYSK
jgi:O-antigen ligase